MAHVQVIQTSHGYLPSLFWGEGENAGRETHIDTFESLETAERVARNWAAEQDATYIAFKPVDQEAIRRHSLLVKKLREEEGLDLRYAIAKAREIEAQIEKG